MRLGVLLFLAVSIVGGLQQNSVQLVPQALSAAEFETHENIQKSDDTELFDWGKALDVVGKAVNTAQKVADVVTQPKPVHTSWFPTSTARDILEFARMAYCPRPALKSWTCLLCRRGATASVRHLAQFHHDVTKTFGFLAYRPAQNELVLSFRGTEPSIIENVIQDVVAMAKTTHDYNNIAGAKIGLGWWTAWHAIQPYVFGAVEAARSVYPSARLHVTGHSLGGVIATLAALDLRILGYTNLRVWTYGSPRVGNAKFSDYWNNKIGWANSFRMVHDDDVIPHYPPNLFRHVGREVWQMDNTHYKVCSDTNSEDPACSKDVSPALWNVNDHKYYMGVRAACSDN